MPRRSYGRRHIPDNDDETVVSAPEDVLDSLAALKDSVRSTERAIAGTDGQG